jgi:hypothetical protein
MHGRTILPRADGIQRTARGRSFGEHAAPAPSTLEHDPLPVHGQGVTYNHYDYFTAGTCGSVFDAAVRRRGNFDARFIASMCGSKVWFSE